MLILLAMSGAAAAVRAVMTNITGYLAFIIPVAMSAGAALGLNPVVCGLVVVVVGEVIDQPEVSDQSRRHHRGNPTRQQCRGRQPIQRAHG